MATFLSELYDIDLARIVANIYASDKKWRFLGLYFQKSHGFTITERQLKAKYPNSNDETLCEYLIAGLAERRIKILELANALDDPLVGLNTVADALITTLYDVKMNDNNTNVLPPAQQAPDDMMDVHQPPPTKRHAVNKYLIYSHTSNELSQNIDQLLEEHGYKRDLQLHNFYLWHYAELEDHDSYVLTLPLGERSKLPIIEELLPHASDTLFLACNPDQSPNSNQIDREKLDDMLQMSFDLIREEVEKLASNQEYYSVSCIDLDSLAKDAFLFRWLARLTHKASTPVYLQLKFRNNIIDFAKAKRDTKETLEQNCGTSGKEAKPKGHCRGCTQIYFSGPSILSAVLYFKKDEIHDELRQKGLDLVSITQVFVEDIITAMRRPENEEYRDVLYDMICDMETDHVPLSFDGYKFNVTFAQEENITPLPNHPPTTPGEVIEKLVKEKMTTAPETSSPLDTLDYYNIGDIMRFDTENPELLTTFSNEIAQLHTLTLREEIKQTIFADNIAKKNPHITLRLFLCCGTLPLRKAKPDPLPMAGVLINDTPVYWSKRTARIIQVKNSRNFFLFSPLKDIIEIPYSDEIADKIVAFIHQRKLDPNFYTPRNSSHLFTKWLVQTVMPNYKPSGLIGMHIQDVVRGDDLTRNEKNELVYHVKLSDSRTISFANHSELDRVQQEANISPGTPDYLFLQIFHRAFQAPISFGQSCPFYGTIKFGSTEKYTLDGNPLETIDEKRPVA